MASVPTGSTFFVATAFASAKTTTAVTNAAPPVCTATTHGYSTGDLVEVTSGWGPLNKQYRRVTVVDTNSFSLEGADSTATDLFPPGIGVGSTRKVTTFVQITSVMNPTTSGGDPKPVEYKFVESPIAYSINDGFSAVSTSLNIDADANTSAGYLALRTLTQVQTDTVLKTVLKNGSFTLLPCKVALNEAIKFQDGQINTCSVTFNGNNAPTRY
jgi:hypothetical protein